MRKDVLSVEKQLMEVAQERSNVGIVEETIDPHKERTESMKLIKTSM